MVFVTGAPRASAPRLSAHVCFALTTAAGVIETYAALAP